MVRGEKLNTSIPPRDNYTTLEEVPNSEIMSGSNYNDVRWKIAMDDPRKFANMKREHQYNQINQTKDARNVKGREDRSYELANRKMVNAYKYDAIKGSTNAAQMEYKDISYRRAEWKREYDRVNEQRKLDRDKKSNTIA